MYSSYQTKNLNEYNKIVRVLETAETADHYDVVVAMVKRFGENCERRCEKLLINSFKSLFVVPKLKYYFKYKSAAQLQFDDLLQICNEWSDSYLKAVELMAQQPEQTHQKQKKKKSISGFSKTFKSKS